MDASPASGDRPSQARRAFVGLPGAREPVPFIPIVVRAAAEDTDGNFEVYELGIPTGAVRDAVGKGPPPHVHRQHEEVFYILEGELTFSLDDETAVAPAGTLLIVPRGIRHGFIGEAGSRALVFAIPGGLAGFFQELGAGLAAGRSDAEMRTDLASRYDSHPAPG